MESRFNVVSVAVTTGKLEISKAGIFKDFEWKEEYVEDLLVNGIMLFPAGDVKIIGRQVQSEYSWKADLIGLKKNGDLVVIEVKRDATDMANRKEPCEIQVIRYASGLMDVQSIEDIVDRMYFDFSATRMDLSDKDGTETREILVGELQSHLHPHANINNKQHLMIVASGFDAGTISACHWLHHNDVVVSCMQISPFKNEEGRVLLVVDRVFPLESLRELKDRTISRRARTGDKAKFQSTFDMLDVGLIHRGQIIYLKGTNSTAEIVDGDIVREDNKDLRWNEWAKSHKSGSFSIYRVICVNSVNGPTLHELRTSTVTLNEVEQN